MFTPDEIQKFINEIAAKAMTANAEILAKMLQEYFALLGRMYANLSKGQDLTWTQLNAYNRFKQYLDEFNKITHSSYVKVLNNIKETREAVFVEAYARDTYNIQYQTGNDLGFSLPSQNVIDHILSNQIDKMKLDKVLTKHRKEIVKKIQISIATGVQQGEGYPQIAKRIQQEVDFSRKKANLVTRTEIGRSRSLANEKVYQQARKRMEIDKIWLATLDHRTRFDHRTLDLQHADDKGYFHIRGLKSKAPRLFGVAHEDINCRCTVVLSPGVSRKARDYDDVNYQKKLANRIDNLMSEGLTEKQAEKRAKAEIKPPNKIVKWQSYDEWNKQLINDDPNSRIQFRRNKAIRFGEHKKFERRLYDELINIETVRVKNDLNLNVFISESITNKKAVARYHLNQIKEILNDFPFDISGLEKPHIVIVDNNETSDRVLAGYHPKTNTLFIRACLSDDEIVEYQQQGGTNYLVASSNPNSTLLHELAHWFQIQNAKGKYSNKGIKNLPAIINKMNNSLIEILDNKGYNIKKDISVYASSNAYMKPEEVFAESFVKGVYEGDEELLEILRGVIDYDCVK